MWIRYKTPLPHKTNDNKTGKHGQDQHLQDEAISNSLGSFPSPLMEMNPSLTIIWGVLLQRKIKAESVKNSEFSCCEFPSWVSPLSNSVVFTTKSLATPVTGGTTGLVTTEERQDDLGVPPKFCPQRTVPISPAWKFPESLHAQGLFPLNPKLAVWMTLSLGYLSKKDHQQLLNMAATWGGRSFWSKQEAGFYF